MIETYTIKDVPEISKVIAFSDLEQLQGKSFLVFILNTLNEDECNDWVESLGNLNLSCPVIVSKNDMSVHEIVEKVKESDVQ